MSIKVVVAGLPYSSNLGDGLISEALLRDLSNFDVEVHAFDFSGRKKFGDVISSKRNVAVSLLQRMPSFFSRLIFLVAFIVVIRKRLRKHYEENIRDADFLMIGGGQIISDRSLNYPLKIYLLARLARRMSLNYGFISVGVASNFSWIGRKLMESAMSNAEIVTVRDELSLERVKRIFGLPSARLCFDPVLPKDSEVRFLSKPISTVGINIINPILARYSSSGAFQLDLKNYALEVEEMIRLFVADGKKCVLFCNGDESDYRVMDEISIGQYGELVTKIVRPVFPVELERVVASVDVVVSWRLHACIAALAASVPVVGLSWDEKLSSLFDLYDIKRWYVQSEIGFSKVVFSVVKSMPANSVKWSVHRRESPGLVLKMRQVLGEIGFE